MPRRKIERSADEEAEFKRIRREKRNEQQRKRRAMIKNVNSNALYNSLRTQNKMTSHTVDFQNTVSSPIHEQINSQNSTINNDMSNQHIPNDASQEPSTSTPTTFGSVTEERRIPPELRNTIQFHDCTDRLLMSIINKKTENYIGKMEIKCRWCNAKHFAAEKVANKGNSFNDCCRHGEVMIDPMPTTPTILQSLFEGTHEKSKNFFDRIRNYNSAFSFASFNANLLNFNNQRRGSFCFKIQGQINYQINTAFYPSADESPTYGQLFIVDPNEAAEIRQTRNVQCDKDLLKSIDAIIREHNIFAKSYQMMKDVLACESTFDDNGTVTEPELHLLFTLKPGMDSRRYNFQRTNEVAAVFSTTADGEIPESYVTVRNKSTKTFQYLSTMDPNTEPWIYPLFYPYGNPGWHERLACVNKKERRVTRADYYKFKLAIRDDFNIYLMGRRLTQQWVVDSYVKIEKDRLNYCKLNQKKLRAESYQGLLDYLRSQSNNENRNIGKVIVLPSSFPNSPRNMLQHYQDAMSIVRKFRTPDLFITMTCNPKWTEITENLLPGQTPSDRPDLVARVFDIKKKALIEMIVKNNLFGEVIAYTWVIEFQKRGLPHLHMLLTLKSNYKITTPDIVDKFISAQIPDKVKHPTLYNIVTKNMLHGPCGDWCLVNGKCSKHFPKNFQTETIMDENRYPLYRRSDCGTLFTRDGTHFFDNRHVVPYNPTLLETFNCHINTEVVSTVKVVKYFYKYVYKGHDKAGITINGSIPNIHVTSTNDNEQISSDVATNKNHDEIRDFVDARYVGPVEAVWRILSKSLQDKSHAIIRLPIHLPNEQSITISDDCDENDLQEALQRHTMLIDYFSLNERDPSARQYLYSDIPHHYVFKKCDKSKNSYWSPRKKHFNVIGRMYSVSPAQIELFHLRLLLLNFKGAKSYEELRTVQGQVFENFTSACLGLGLIEDDQEWKRTLNDASIWMMPRQLRCLFARILIHCQPLCPEELWEEFKGLMSEDLIRRFGVESGQKRAYLFISNMLNKEGYSLAAYPNMPLINEVDNFEDEMLLSDAVEPELQSNYNKLNVNQKQVVDHILDYMKTKNNSNTDCIYIDGPGGSGKTFIYTSIYNILKNQNKNICTMAYTGIAATLLPNGKTVHKTFNLPVPMFSDSSANVKPNSKQGDYLKDIDVFIWDEAPMAPRYSLEIIDRTLQNIMNNNIPFGGKLMILGGDFRQLLPIKLHATRSETVNLSIKYSLLWRHFRKFSLTQNMRALPEEIDFAKFLIDIGDGILNDSNDTINLPSTCSVSKSNTIVEDIYGNIIRGKRFEELTGTVILSVRNVDVDEINNRVVELLDSSSERVFTSVDNAENCDDGGIDDLILPEYLNTLNPPNFPPLELKLRKNTTIMLIRNLNLSEGLCNGTRLIILDMRNNVILCGILTGDKSGDIVFINRITLYCENVYPFTFKRRQFPIKVAFCMTINKSQGQTFDKIGIDLTRDVCNHGQLYVALSRVRSWASLKVYLNTHKTDNSVKNFVFKELYL